MSVCEFVRFLDFVLLSCPSLPIIVVIVHHKIR
jgi:hypothetical protein